MVQRFRGGLVLKAHRLCVSLNSKLESNKEEEEEVHRVGLCSPAARDGEELHVDIFFSYTSILGDI